MKFRQWIVVVPVLLFGAAGCRTPRGFDQMEGELRFQEDRIYQLEDWCRQYRDLLDNCRNENTALRGKVGADGKPAKPVRVAPFEETGPKGSTPPQVEIPIPEVEIPGGDATPGGSSGPQLPKPAPRKTPPGGAMNRPRRRVVSDSAIADGGAVAPLGSVALASLTKDDSEPESKVHLSSYEAPAAQDSTVARITFNRLLTSGLNRDGQPGDEGLMVLVEPRNAANELIPPTGELSISVIDPAATTVEEARVGRWDYGAAETARMYRHSPLGDGIELNLVWPKHPTTHRRLDVHARLITADGRQFTIRQRVTITPPPAPKAVPTPAVEEAPTPALTPEPVERRTEKDGNLFEVQPVSSVSAPAVLPAPVAVTPVTAARPAAPPAPLVVVPAGPPADEQVGIPAEAGTTPAPATPAPIVTSGGVAPPTSPRWSPFR